MLQISSQLVHYSSYLGCYCFPDSTPSFQYQHLKQDFQYCLAFLKETYYLDYLDLDGNWYLSDLRFWHFYHSYLTCLKTVLHHCSRCWVPYQVLDIFVMIILLPTTKIPYHSLLASSCDSISYPFPFLNYYSRATVIMNYSTDHELTCFVTDKVAICSFDELVEN